MNKNLWVAFVELPQQPPLLFGGEFGVLVDCLEQRPNFFFGGFLCVFWIGLSAHSGAVCWSCCKERLEKKNWSERWILPQRLHKQHLKVNSANEFYTLKSVYRSWGSTSAYVEKSGIKPYVAPEEAACNLKNCLHWWQLMAMLHCGLCRQRVEKEQESVERKRCLIICLGLSVIHPAGLFKICHLRYPQCNLATEWCLLRQFIKSQQASSGATKGLPRFFFLHVRQYSMRPVNTL